MEEFRIHDIEAYEKGWGEEMMKIWREKIDQMDVRRTGALLRSFKMTFTRGEERVLTHRFLQYGIYQANGVGRFYAKGNGGNLRFLDTGYRAEHHLNEPKQLHPHSWQGGGVTSGKPRQRRYWFHPRYIASLRKLNDVEGLFYGENYQGLLSEVVQAMFYTF